MGAGAEAPGPEDGFPNNEALVGVAAMAEKKGEEQENFKPPAGHLRCAAPVVPFKLTERGGACRVPCREGEGHVTYPRSRS